MHCVNLQKQKGQLENDTERQGCEENRGVNDKQYFFIVIVDQDVTQKKDGFKSTLMPSIYREQDHHFKINIEQIIYYLYVLKLSILC